MNQFLLPIVTLTGIGLFFALVLAWASRKFAVAQDPRIQQILEKLPGANCGACGMAGCASFGEALAAGQASLQNCKACSQEQADEIARILGVATGTAQKMVASLRCYGGTKAKDKFVYQGIKDCQADALMLGGHKLCSWACLGLGSCRRACPFGAIQMSPEGLPRIARELCTGCGKCVEVCPRNLMALIPKEAKVVVGCSSKEPAKETIRVCSAGCIACKKCEQVCPEKAIKVVENPAVIDYDKCTSCGKCVEACPRKIIKA